jgi:hypothetical protein
MVKIHVNFELFDIEHLCWCAGYLFCFMDIHIHFHAGADWLPKFWWDFFSRGPKKKMLTKKGQSEVQSSSADEKKGH